MVGSKLLSVKEAATRIGLSKSTLDKLRVYGGGPCYAKLGRSIRYAEDDLEAWIAAGRRSSTSVSVAVANDGHKSLIAKSHASIC